jgi:hypothetical protein
MRSAVREVVTSVLAAIVIFAVIVTAAGAIAHGTSAGAARPSIVLALPTPDPHP